MAFCHLYYWDKGMFGHTGLALQTHAGLKIYITMLQQGGQGYAPSLPEELRLWTAIRGNNQVTERDRHEQIARGGQMRPGQRAQKHTGRVVLGRRDSGGFRRNAGMSLVLEGGQVYQQPTEIVEIPVLSPTTFGVDVDRIFYWWRSYGMRGMSDRNRGTETPRPQFRALSASNNCAGTTALALIVGGAKYFKYRARQCYVSTPSGVRDWAKEVRDAAIEINRAKALSVRYELGQARKKRTELEMKLKKIKQQNPKDLPTLQEWKDISYVGPFARRKEQIATIDILLKRYHELPWDIEQDDEKARILDNIIREAENHAITKPASDRLHAVAYMLEQAWKVLDGRLRAFTDKRSQFKYMTKAEFYVYANGSLQLTPEEFEDIFMGDEWLTQLEECPPVEVVDEKVDNLNLDAFQHRAFSDKSPMEYVGSRKDVSKEFRASFSGDGRRRESGPEIVDAASEAGSVGSFTSSQE